ncbi:MAG: SixA phosphatase family protein [Chthoniobacterales bacterium]
MKLYFLRHADATWADWSEPDDERPLTKKGRKQSCRVGKLLDRLCVDPELILTSPLPRAFQTAEIVAHRLCIDFKEEPALGKSFNLAKLRAMITRTKGHDLMVVGHEPDFSAVIRQLTGGRVRLAKAGVARIDLASPESDGTLVWLMTPKCARAVVSARRG